MLGVRKNKSSHATASTSTKATGTSAREFLQPYTHLGPHTLVTKDGGVMQTLRISENNFGLNYEPSDQNGHNLRDCIRRAVATHIPGPHFSLWVHTLRKRRKVSFDARYDNDFAAHVNHGWRAKHGWSHHYYNEVYVTLLYDGQSGQLFDKDLAREGWTVKRNRTLRNTYLQSASAELDLVMSTIIDEIAEHYRVHRLSLVERFEPGAKGLPNAPVVYSEPMEFLGYLLNLRDEPMPLPDADISDALQSCELMFGFNAMETKNPDGVKRFGALLSLKHYREVPPATVDMLLQAPMELIISQAFHFIPGETALKEYREQKDYFDMSGDEYSMRASGLTEMLQAQKDRPTDFGYQQTSIMVVVDELKKIDEDIGRLQEAFSGLGLVCVREDIRQEEIFWSMFPGNFVFLRRRFAISSSRIAGFAKLNRFASGEREQNFWPQPVTLIPTLVNSPYFFHFHDQDNGHTLWLDFNSFHDALSNRSLFFLLTQAHKLKPRLLYLDYRQQASLWFDKMGARHQTLRRGAEPGGLTLNPFSLDESPRNLGFLAAWCAELVEATEAERPAIKSSVQSLYAAGTPRNLRTFVEHLASHDASLAERFAPWLKPTEDGGVCFGDTDEFAFAHEWLAVDITEAMHSAQEAVATVAYLLHRLILSLDGSPTIIVLQHAFPILSQPFFSSRLESLLAMLRENNAMLIASISMNESLGAHPLMKTLASQCGSTVIVPDDLNLDYSKLLPGLVDANDQGLLHIMQRDQGDILLRQGRTSVALRLNIDMMPDVAAIYAGDVKTLISAGGPFAKLPGGRRDA